MYNTELIFKQVDIYILSEYLGVALKVSIRGIAPSFNKRLRALSCGYMEVKDKA